MISKITLVSIFTFFSSSFLLSQSLDSLRLHQFFESLAAQNQAMGSIAIVKDGKVLYQRAIGIKTLEENPSQGVTPKTKYRIWSITKTYIATAILQQVEQGNLALHTKLSQFFPSIKNADSITIEHLLQHRSGIFDYTQMHGLSPEESLRITSTKSNLTQKIATFDPEFTPDERFSYSNSNYVLLGYILETLQDQPLQEILETSIFNPVQLHSTYLGSKQPSPEIDECLAFDWKANQWQLVEEATLKAAEPAGAGGLVGTAADVALFMDALAQGKLLPQSQVDKMRQWKEGYGIGLHPINFVEGLEGFGHTGGHLVSRSIAGHFPSLGISVAYLTNGENFPMEFVIATTLRIVQNKPTGISWLRPNLLLGIWALLAAVGLILYLKRPFSIPSKDINRIGYTIPIFFWIGIFVGAFLKGDHHWISNLIFNLESHYSASGNFMATMLFLNGGLFFVWWVNALQVSKKSFGNLLPIILLFLLPIGWIGRALFPEPHANLSIFANLPFLVALSPFSALFSWRVQMDPKWKWLTLSLLITPIIVLITRPWMGPYTHDKMGALHLLFILGWTIWLVKTSQMLDKVLELNTISPKSQALPTESNV